MPQKLDEIDRKILRALQKDGRMSNAQLADAVGLSPSPCLRRVRQLEEAGIITGYAAVLDATKLGLGMTLLVRVWLAKQDLGTVEHFTEEIRKLPNVLECLVMAGDCDFVLRVVVRDFEHYRNFQSQHLHRISGVANVKTEVPMESVKLTNFLPV